MNTSLMAQTTNRRRLGSSHRLDLIYHLQEMVKLKQPDLVRINEILEEALDNGWLTGVCFGQHQENSDDNIEYSCAVLHVIKNDKIDVLNMFLEYGLNANSLMPNSVGSRLLHEVIKVGSMEMLESLVTYGADTIKTDQNGQTTLAIAVLENKPEFFIKLKFDNIADSYGETPLMYYMNGRVELGESVLSSLKLLLTIYPEMQVCKQKNGLTALHLAVLMVSDQFVYEVVKMLLGNGCDVNVKDADERSVLHYICGENATSVEYIERTPSKVCQIVTLLLQNGAHSNDVDRDMNRPLHIAIKANRPKVVEILIQYHADFNIRNYDGLKPLDLCFDDDKKVIIEHILRETKRITVRQKSDSKHFTKLLSKLDEIEGVVTKIDKKLYQCMLDANASDDFKTLTVLVQEGKTFVEDNLAVLFQPDIIRDRTIDVFSRACIEISKCIGYDWKMLFRHLYNKNFCMIETLIAEIEDRYATSLQEQAYQALLAWKKQYGNGANLHSLVEGLESFGNKELSQNIKKKYI